MLAIRSRCWSESSAVKLAVEEETEEEEEDEAEEEEAEEEEEVERLYRCPSPT